MWGPRFGPRGTERMPATVIISDLLWLGSTADALDEEGLKSNGIKARINVRTTDLPPIEGIDTYWEPLIDWWGNTPEGFLSAVDRLEELQLNSVPTLLHCHMGISRSTSVLAAWMSRRRRGEDTFDQCVDWIRTVRPFVMPFVGVRDVARFCLGEIGAHAVCSSCLIETYFDAPHAYVDYEYKCKNCGHPNMVNAYKSPKVPSSS